MYEKINFPGDNPRPETYYPSFYESVATLLDQAPLTLAECQRTTLVFQTLFDDFMLRHLSYCRQYDERVVPLREALLVGTISLDRQLYDVLLQDRASSEVSQLKGDTAHYGIVRELCLQRVFGEAGLEYWSYRLGLDNVVRRYSEGNVSHNQQQQYLLQGCQRRRSAELPIRLSRLIYMELMVRQHIEAIQTESDGQTQLLDDCQTQRQKLLAAADILVEDLPAELATDDLSALELEEKLGLNMQPVSMAEMMGLSQFLLQQTNFRAW